MQRVLEAKCLAVLAWVLLAWVLLCCLRLGSKAQCSNRQCSNRLGSNRPAISRPELLLRGGTVVDGTGAEARQADVAIQAGKIVAIGVGLPEGDMTIDCRGLIVCPGFIDLHTHSDSALVDAKTRGNVNYLLQGCTTVVTGNCGIGPVNVAEYLAKIDAGGAGTHVAHLLPHGTCAIKLWAKRIDQRLLRTGEDVRTR